MAVVVPHRAVEAISKSSDPKKTIMDLAGDLSGIEIMGDRVLVGIFMRPEKTAGGIIRPEVNKQEDVWQGKVGLVLKLGPNAFVDPGDGTKYDQRVEVGDWGVFYVGDAKQLTINNMPCRLVIDTSFVAKVADPNMVF